MKIFVLVKQVPDTWGDRKLDVTAGRLDRAASDLVIDEVGERAMEVALSYQDSAGAEVVALTLGPATASEIIQRSLAMGADSAIHIKDDSLEGADMVWTAQVLAEAIRRSGFDLVIAGNQSTDGRGGAVPAMVAELLGVPHATSLNSVELSESSVSGERATDYGTLTVGSSLPAVISVTERAPEPRFPTFRGIMKAKKKPVEVIGVEGLGIAPRGGQASSVVISTALRPQRQGGKKIVDSGTAGHELAEFLAAEHLI